MMFNYAQARVYHNCTHIRTRTYTLCTAYYDLSSGMWHRLSW